MQLISKFNKEFRFLLRVIDNKGFIFLLCVINIYSKYAWVIPLKDKKAIAITNAFQKSLDGSNRKPKEIWVDEAVKFIINQWNHFCRTMT